MCMRARADVPWQSFFSSDLASTAAPQSHALSVHLLALSAKSLMEHKQVRSLLEKKCVSEKEVQRQWMSDVSSGKNAYMDMQWVLATSAFQQSVMHFSIPLADTPARNTTRRVVKMR